MPAITHRGSDIVVTAGAGTGKTRTLVSRYVSLLAEGMNPRQIAAITFTHKAANEMRNRVRSAITAYSQQIDEAVEAGRWRDYSEALDAARIGTIHSLCSDILRSNPAEAGVDPHFTVLEEADGVLLKADAVDAALAWASRQSHGAALFALFGERKLRQLMQDLLKNRTEAAATFAALPADIMAHWHHQLRLRQQEQLQNAVKDDAYRCPLADLRANQPSHDDDMMAVQRAMVLTAARQFEQAPEWEARLLTIRQLGAINLSGGRQGSWPGGKEQLQEVKDALRTLRDWWKGQERLCSLDPNDSDHALAAVLPFLRELFAAAEKTYVAAIRRRRLLDFDDLEVMALALLRENTQVCRRWQREITAILVDEYQDTNARQRDLLNLINGDGHKLFIVGDAKQSIYRFRGADITVFSQEGARIAEFGRALELARSYRAHEALVDALNALLRPVLGDPGAMLPVWRAPFSPLIATREDPAFGFESPHVELHLTVGSKQSGALDRCARHLVDRLLALRAASDGALNFADVAILCRASTSFAAYENALDAAGIPFITVAGRGFFERPEIRDLLNTLQAIADPLDDLALVGYLRSPVSGLDDGDLYALTELQRATSRLKLWHTVRDAAQATDNAPLQKAVALLQGLHGRVGRLTVAELLKAYLDASGYRAALRLAEQGRALRNVDKLLEITHRSGYVSSADFLEYVTQLRTGIVREGEARASAENAVQIMSVHQAKGLEFPIVVIGDTSYQPPSLDRYFLDDELGFVAQVAKKQGQKAAAFELASIENEMQEAAESARLLYVAATRARDRLIITGVAATNRNGGFSRQRGWLKLLDASLQLGEIDLAYDENGTRCHTPRLNHSQHATCHIYEPGYTAHALLDREPPPSLDQDFPSPRLIHTSFIDLSATEEAQPEGVWRIIPANGAATVPAHFIGRLVHEALRLWRFPSAAGDAQFEQLIAAGARQLGIVDAQSLESACNHVTTLLARFHDHALYTTIVRATQRLHEVPFTLPTPEGRERRTHHHSARLVSGRIDLLYRDDQGWHIVDFKSEPLAGRAMLEQRLDGGYREQVETYLRAVQRLLGVTPDAQICFLDVMGQIELVDIRH